MSKHRENTTSKGVFGWFGKKHSQPSEQAVINEAEDIREERIAAEVDQTEEIIAASKAPENSVDFTLNEESATAALSPENIQQPEPQNKPGFFSRLRKGLKKTRESFAGGLADLFHGNKHIDDELFEQIETQLLISDVGIDATQNIISQLTEQVSRKQLANSAALFESLQQILAQILTPVEQPLQIPSSSTPFVILMVGVNGVGKTTTIGKLAKSFQQQGKKVMLAAGDTFRAAAVEQLQVWGQRNDVPVIAQHTGADSASVVFDALQAATARGVDILIADTAGRLQNQTHLMDELAKVKRVLQKIDPAAPHETLLVLDAGTGQNAINQTQQFHQEIGLTGLAVSKLDGTAKGGVLFALAEKFSIPVRYIGVGESIDDLRTFNATDFIDALFQQQTDAEAPATDLGNPSI